MNLNIADWNSLDWMLVAVLVFSTLRAVMRGLVRALFGLLGIAGGFELATWNYIAVGNWLFERQIVASVPTARIAAFLGIAIVVVIVFELVGRGVKKTTHAIGLGPIDRGLGGVFGFARGVLIGVAVILGIMGVSTQPELVTKSQLSSYFLGAAHAVSFVVPRDLR